jgi:hypothetical protein
MAGLVPAIPILNRDRRDEPGDDSDVGQAEKAGSEVSTARK